MSDEQTGRCLCGAVKFKLTAAHTDVGVCHCSNCRRWGSGPYMAIDVGRDIQIEGEANITVYRSSEWAERAFCNTCGSNLFYRLVDSGDHFICAGILDDPAKLELTSQVFIDEKPDFYEFANDTKKMTGAEVFALYAPTDDGSE